MIVAAPAVVADGRGAARVGRRDGGERRVRRRHGCAQQRAGEGAIGHAHAGAGQRWSGAVEDFVSALMSEGQPMIDARQSGLVTHTTPAGDVRAFVRVIEPPVRLVDLRRGR